MPKTFFLDFDGVIVDSLGYYLKSANVALTQSGYAAELNAAHIEPLDSIDLTRLATMVGMPAHEHRDYISAVVREMKKLHAPLPLFEQMDWVVSELAQQGDVVIVSLSDPTLIERACEHHALSPHLSAIYSRREPGNKTEQMGHWLQQGGGEPSEAVLVGDSVSDIRYAQQANVRSIGVSWGWQPNRILDCGADQVVHSPGELREALR